MIEQIVLNILLIAFFIYFFYKTLKKGYTVYFIVLVIETISILLNLLHIKFGILNNIYFKIVMFALSIILPGIIVLIESSKHDIVEVILIKLSRFYILINNRKKAKKILLPLEEKYPNNIEINVLLAGIYETEGGLRKSIDEYVKVLEFDKSNHEVYYKIAELLSELNKIDEAIEMLNNLTKTRPEFYISFKLLGNLLLKKEMFKEALNVFIQAEEHIDNDYEICYNMGIVYTRLNDFPNAQKYFKKAIEKNKQLYIAYYYLAQIALILDDKEVAEEYFKQSAKEDNLTHLAYFELAKIYMRAKKSLIAVESLNKALDIAPTMMEKVNNETLFVPIRKSLILPEEERRGIKDILTEPELKVMEHLEETYNLVGKLNYKS